MIPHHKRKPIRLPGYDYSMPGAYFITACTKNRDFLFETQDTKLAVESAWYSVVNVFANIELDEFVVMPNHIHGIVWIKGAIKTTAATRVNKLRSLVGVPVWQKSFYNRIIRNDREFRSNTKIYSQQSQKLGPRSR